MGADRNSLDKKRIDTDTFDESRETKCLAWLENYGASRNLYFSVGEVARDVEKKAERTDIVNVWWLHVDVDPRAGEDVAQEQARALGLLQNPPGLPPPSAIVYSGGGYQGFWQLREPIAIDCDLAKAEDAKLYNLAIELALGADNVHDISRIMRLPGTLNRPDELKVKKGRTLALATLAEWHPERVYDIGQFPKSRAVAPAADSPKVNLSGNVKRLPLWPTSGDLLSFPSFTILDRALSAVPPRPSAFRLALISYVVAPPR